MKPRPGQTALPWMGAQGVGDSAPMVEAAVAPTRKWTLGSVRVWLRARVDKGTVCPCCGQHAKVYKRTLNSAMAYVLILMARTPLEDMDGHGYFHVPSYLNSIGLRPGVSAAIRGDWAKLVHWDLIEPAPKEREDGSSRTGYWRLTELGLSFVHRKVRVMSHVKIYDSKCIGLAGEHIHIHEALGKRFDYQEIMGDASDNPIDP